MPDAASFPTGHLDRQAGPEPWCGPPHERGWHEWAFPGAWAMLYTQVVALGANRDAAPCSRLQLSHESEANLVGFAWAILPVLMLPAPAATAADQWKYNLACVVPWYIRPLDNITPHLISIKSFYLARKAWCHVHQSLLGRTGIPARGCRASPYSAPQDMAANHTGHERSELLSVKRWPVSRARSRSNILQAHVQLSEGLPAVLSVLFVVSLFYFLLVLKDSVT